MAYQRIDGKTPHGGDYAEAHFFDKDGNSTEKQFAETMIVIEFTQDGKIVHQTRLGKKRHDDE